jgi:hypothetical protein
MKFAVVVALISEGLILVFKYVMFASYLYSM